MITGILGTEYRDLLVESITYGKRGRSDLSAYFFLRSYSLLSAGSTFGLIATNTIAQGDTREVGLDQLAVQGGVIFRAVPSRKWIGTASLEVAHIWICKGNWSTTAVLEEVVVPSITPYLTVPSKASGKPYRLYGNAGISFEGSKPTGMGFVLEPEEAHALIKKNPKNKDVLFPYLNAEDLNSHPEQLPSRWIINFFDWALDPEQDDPKNTTWQVTGNEKR